MDAYAAVLELLRADDFRRIRGYLGDGRCKFTTWLVVVARRGCIDFARHRYGRTDGQSATNGAKQAVRRELASRLRSVEDVDVLLDAWDNRPDARLRAKEMHAGLGKSLAALPPDERLIMKLRFSDELSAREIAEATGAQSPFHVYRRITAILTKLRRLLASDGIDGSAP
jgi:RNA polymerase sigma factor (sigma-70 family)